MTTTGDDSPCLPLAHVRQDEAGQWHLHPLAGHLEGTARLSEAFAGSFGNGDWGRLAGLWHDLGKFSPEFQGYIRKASGYDPDAHIEGAPGKVDHSTVDAAIRRAQALLAPYRPEDGSLLSDQLIAERREEYRRDHEGA